MTSTSTARRRSSMLRWSKGAARSGPAFRPPESRSHAALIEMWAGASVIVAMVIEARMRAVRVAMMDAGRIDQGAR